MRQRVGRNRSLSDWQTVTNGKLQGSVRRIELFALYLNDSEETTKCIISKFADDAKLAGRLNSEEDEEMFQRGLDGLSVWGYAWQMHVNADECEFIHFVINNRVTDIEWVLN